MMERRFVKSGIPGLDKLLGGGFLEGSITTVSGPTGSGKSTLALQYLYKGASEFNEPGLYICIEESRQDFQFHVSGYNWDFAKAEKERKFILLDYPIHEVDQILNQYSAIAEIISSTGVKRVVIDSIMPIALFFKEDDERKKGFLKLIENIRKWNVTTLIVSEDMKATNLGVLPNSAYGIETFTDGWINFTNNYDPKRGERVRMIEVLKMKGITHSYKPYPAVIDANGVTIVMEEMAAPEQRPRPRIPGEMSLAEAILPSIEKEPGMRQGPQRLAFAGNKNPFAPSEKRKAPPQKQKTPGALSKSAGKGAVKAAGSGSKSAIAPETPAAIAKRLAAVKKKLLKMKKRG